MNPPRDFHEILGVMLRVVKEPDAHIDVYFVGLAVRVYPGRHFTHQTQSADRFKERLKHLTAFLLALTDTLDGPPRFAFESDRGKLLLGLRRDDESYVWMPCEILRLIPDVDGPTAVFSFPDDRGESIEFPRPSLRRIDV